MLILYVLLVATVHLWLGVWLHVGIRGRRLGVKIIRPAVHRRVGIRCDVLNWCWRLVKAIVVSFHIAVCVVVGSVLLLLKIRVIIPVILRRLGLLMVHGLHIGLLHVVVLRIVVPIHRLRILILKLEEKIFSLHSRICKAELTHESYCCTSFELAGAFRTWSNLLEYSLTA